MRLELSNYLEKKRKTLRCKNRSTIILTLQTTLLYNREKWDANKNYVWKISFPYVIKFVLFCKDFCLVQVCSWWIITLHMIQIIWQILFRRRHDESNVQMQFSLITSCYWTIILNVLNVDWIKENFIKWSDL